MADIVNKNGKWVMSNLFVTGLTDDVKFDITFTYKDSSFTVTGVSKDSYSRIIETPWVTELNENINLEDIKYSAEPAYSSDGKTKYVINKISFNMKGYNPSVTGTTEPETEQDVKYVDGLAAGVAECTIEIEDIPNLFGQGKYSPVAKYIVKVNGEVTNTNEIKEGIWTSSDETVAYFDDNVLLYSNTGDTARVITISCTYNNITETKSITIQKEKEKQEEIKTHKLVLTPKVKEGYTEPYLYNNDIGIITIKAVFYKGYEVLSYWEKDPDYGPADDPGNVSDIVEWSCDNPIVKIYPFATEASVTWLNTKGTEQTVTIRASFKGIHAEESYTFRVAASENAGGTFVITPTTEDKINMVLPTTGEQDFKAYFSLGDIHENDVTNDVQWSVDNSNIAKISENGKLEYSNNSDSVQSFSVIAKYKYGDYLYEKTTRLCVCSKNTSVANLIFYVTPTERVDSEEYPYGVVRVPLATTAGFTMQKFDNNGVAKIEGKYQVGSTISYTVIKKGYVTITNAYKINSAGENGIQVTLVPDNEAVETKRELQIILSDKNSEIDDGSINAAIFEKTYVNGVLINQKNVSRDAVVTSDSPMFKGKTYDWLRARLNFTNTNAKAAETITITATYNGLSATESFTIAKKVGKYVYGSAFMVVTNQKTALKPNGATPRCYAWLTHGYGDGQWSAMKVTNCDWSYNDFGTGIIKEGKVNQYGEYVVYYNNTTIFDVPILIEGKAGSDKDGVILIVPGVDTSTDSQVFEYGKFIYTHSDTLLSKNGGKINLSVDSNTAWKFRTLAYNYNREIVDLDWVSCDVDEHSESIENMTVTIAPNRSGSDRNIFIAIQSTVTNDFLDILYVNEEG